MNNRLVACGLALFLLGCDSSIAPASTGAAASAERVKATIGYIPIADHMLLGVSDEREGAELEHVDLDPLRFSNYPTMSEALRSGDLQGAMMLAPLGFQVRLSGTPVKIVLLGHRDGSGLVVDKADGVTELSQLAGRQVAIPHRFSTNNFLLHYYAAEMGIDPAHGIETVEMGPPEMLSALSGGSVDGYITAEPFLSEAEAAGIGEVFVFTSEIWNAHPDCVLVLREDFIAANPEAVQELVDTLVRSGEWVEADRTAAAEVAGRFLGKSTEIMTHALEDPRRVTFHNLVPEIPELERVQDYMAAEMGLFPVKVDMAEMVDTHYATAAYEALAAE